MPILIQAILIIAISLSSTLVAEQIQPEKVQSWPENSNFYGSPNSYYYIASGSRMNGFASTLDHFLKRKIKGNIKMFSSPLGNYWAWGEFVDKMTVDYKMAKVSLYHPSGTKIYSINNPGAMKFILSDQAPLMVGVDGVEGLPEAELFFYDSTGITVNTFKITEFNGGAFTSDGDLFCAHSLDSGLYIFSSSGQLQQRLSVSPHYVVSSQGQTVVSFNAGSIFVHSHAKLSNTVKTDLVKIRSMSIGSDNKTILLISSQKAVCYNIPELIKLWEYELQPEQEHFSSCDVSLDSDRFAFGIAIDNGSDYSYSDRFNRGKLLILNKSGQEIYTGEFSYNSWSKGYPQVKFSDQNNQLWILNHFDLYQVNFE